LSERVCWEQEKYETTEDTNTNKPDHTPGKGHAHHLRVKFFKKDPGKLGNRENLRRCIELCRDNVNKEVDKIFTYDLSTGEMEFRRELENKPRLLMRG
jgi:hypothetical protein